MLYRYLRTYLSIYPSIYRSLALVSCNAFSFALEETGELYVLFCCRPLYGKTSTMYLCNAFMYNPNSAKHPLPVAWRAVAFPTFDQLPQPTLVASRSRPFAGRYDIDHAITSLVTYSFSAFNRFVFLFFFPVFCWSRLDRTGRDRGEPIIPGKGIKKKQGLTRKERGDRRPHTRIGTYLCVYICI